MKIIEDYWSSPWWYHPEIIIEAFSCNEKTEEMHIEWRIDEKAFIHNLLFKQFDLTPEIEYCECCGKDL